MFEHTGVTVRRSRAVSQTVYGSLAGAERLRTWLKASGEFDGGQQVNQSLSP
jgi:hypothetical protein